MVPRLRLCPFDAVLLLAAPQELPALPQQALHGIGPKRRPVDGKQEHEVIAGRPFLHRQGSVHIGFACGQLRIEKKGSVKLFVMQPDGHCWTVLARPEFVHGTRDVDHTHAPALDEGSKKARQQFHGKISKWVSLKRSGR